MSEPQRPPAQPRHPYSTLAELDDAVAAGHVPFNRYWDLREELESRDRTRGEEHRYDLDGGARVRPVMDTRFVAPPPVSVHRGDATPTPPQTLVAPPPPPPTSPVGPVRLPVSGPSADAEPTRAGERRRRRLRRSGPR